jgi:phosphohistidine swiveling domain-containing protein
MDITNSKSYNLAMTLLGIKNKFSAFLKMVSWILDPDSAINLAKKFSTEIKKNRNLEDEIYPRVIAIGYINEFFSKYLAFGKTHKQVIGINTKIDKGIVTNNKIANALIILRKMRKNIAVSDYDQFIETDTKSFGVSKGVAIGNILNIKNTKQNIPKNTIGVFPTSGPLFTPQFIKCKGIIFLNGAITSHGAIIARENNIPAIVAPKTNLKDGQKVEINGADGKVRTT